MDRLLKFLQGKKGTIATIGCIIVTWLYGQAYIDETTAIMIQSILALLTGTASVYTKQLYANSSK